MRPIKELFIEEFWEIAYRDIEQGTVFETNDFSNCHFIHATKRYWYADPMLLKKNEDTYLFVEAYDNSNGKGSIAYSKLVNGRFTKPKVIIEESFHLSYPYVFEYEGNTFIMPETSGDKCIQLYKATDFPEKWEKYERVLEIKNAVDTVFLDNRRLLTSILMNNYEKTTRLQLIDLKNETLSFCTEENQTSRGAGKLFKYNGKLIRPAQNATGGVYGKGLLFYEVTDMENYKEEEWFRFDSKSVVANGVLGVHTYAKSENLEVIDCKKKRFNIYIIFYIIKNKIRKMTQVFYRLFGAKCFNFLKSL